MSMKKLVVYSYPQTIKKIAFRLRFSGALDIRTYFIKSQNVDFSDDGTDVTENKLFKTAKAIGVLSKYQTKKTKPAESVASFADAKKEDKTFEQVNNILDIFRDVQALEDEESEILALFSSLLPFKSYPYALGISETENTETIFLRMGTSVRIKNAEKDRAELEALEALFEPFYAVLEQINRQESTRYLRVICHKCDSEAVRAIITEQGFAVISFPSDFERAPKMIQSVKAMARDNRAKKQEADQKIIAILPELDDIKLLEALYAERLIAENGDGTYGARLDAYFDGEDQDKIEELLLKYELSYEIRTESEGGRVDTEEPMPEEDREAEDI